MDKNEFMSRFNKLIDSHPKSIRVLRNESDIDSMDIDQLIDEKQKEGEAFRVFDNYDENMLIFISECLSEGKEVGIQACDRYRLLIHKARNLFKKNYY